MADPNPILSIALPDGSTIAFESVEALLKFKDSELEFWGALVPSYNGKPFRNGSFLQPALDAINYAAGARDPINRLQANWVATQAIDPGIAEEVRRLLTLAYTERHLPLLTSALGVRVRSLLERSPKLAVVAVYANIPDGLQNGQPFDMSDPMAAEGFVLSAFIKNPSLADMQADDLSALKAEVTNSSAVVRTLESATRVATKALTDETMTLLAKGREQLETQSAAHGTLLSNHGTDLEQYKTQTKEQLEAFKKAIEAQDAFKAPIAYWQSKATLHRNSAIVLAIVVGVAFYVTFQAAVSHAQSLLPDVTTPNTFPLGRVGTFVAASLIVFWVLRLIVRIFLSQLHLATDAAERVTMVQTYLALLAADKAPNKEDLATIVGSLFRPSTDGVVKDEAAPQLWYEWLTRNK